jgi:CMP-N-acetylneuraminic acid synthetase
MSVTAIIPVRSGSVRCKNKNNRLFSDTSLLELKINVLKQVPNISKIIVSSSDTYLLNIASKMGVLQHNRDPSFSTNDITGSELFHCLANAVSEKHMMYVTCVSPFVQPGTYKDAIEKYFLHLENGNYDSVISTKRVTEFLWDKSGPLNYDPYLAPPSQLLPNIQSLTFGFCIVSTRHVQTSSSIVGNKPLLYELNELESIDIDTPFDFTVAELLYSNGFYTYNDILCHDSLTQSHSSKNLPFKILDCTIRDGGYLNNWMYSFEEVLEIYKASSLTGIEYFEVGFICSNSQQEESNGRWWNVCESDFAQLKRENPSGSKLAAMILIENVHKITHKITHLDMIRILVNPKKLELAANIQLFKEHINKLIALGYDISINLAYVDILSLDEFESLLQLIQNIPSIKYVCIADTFGSISTTKLKYLMRIIKYYSNAEIGFHGHNNTQRAVHNSIEAIRNGASLIDVTLQGQGRGGGNTPSELFLQHVNHSFNTNYNILPILQLLDNYNVSESDKLDILYTLSGLKKIHPDIALTCLRKNKTVASAFENLASFSNK